MLDGSRNTCLAWYLGIKIKSNQHSRNTIEKFIKQRTLSSLKTIYPHLELQQPRGSHRYPQRKTHLHWPKKRTTIETTPQDSGPSSWKGPVCVISEGIIGRGEEGDGNASGTIDGQEQADRRVDRWEWAAGERD